MDQTPFAFVPLFDRLLVRPIAEDERTASGLLVIPDVNKPRPRRGVVVAAGPGRVHERTGALAPLAVAVGDRVVYGKYSGGELTLGGEDLLIMREDEVLGLERPARALVDITTAAIEAFHASAARLPEGVEEPAVLGAGLVR